jgi:hypothetical protein
MTEEDWDCCTDPMAMLDFLRGRASERKLRLFACACCRLLWPLLHKRVRRAVSVMENFVEGLADRAAWEKARAGVRENTYWMATPRNTTGGVRRAAFQAAGAVEHAMAPGMDAEAFCRAVVMARLLADEEQDPSSAWRELAELLRDVLGNPSRPSRLDATWLAWHGSAIPRLAHAVYGERGLPGGSLDTGHLAILADMLEEAGCSDAGLLGHLRSAGPHVRGCHAVDLILQRS